MPILNDIIAYKNEQIEQKKQAVSAYKNELKPTAKSLKNALKSRSSSFICEIKPSSPSMGVLRQNPDVLGIAKIYEPFADAISVLSCAKFFGGSLENVQRVSENVACPVLCKDVIVSEWQVYEARKYGADVVLLMLSVLDDERYKRCLNAASSLGMDVITEVHTEEELDRALCLNASIIGINNRNLFTMTVDLETTKKLLPKIPPNVLVISESGFSHHKQVRAISPMVDGFLIGTSLMRAERMDLALRELLFGRVKICGLTHPEDAMAAYDCGAYYGGLNFSKTSKRCVDIHRAEEIIKVAPLQYGGIFVNQPLDEIIGSVHQLKLNFVQLHGDEDKEYMSTLRHEIPNECEIWRAVRVTDHIQWPKRDVSDLLVLDHHALSGFGGQGSSFDWGLLNGLDLSRVALAGGINASNVAKASSFDPFIIDIASGAEEEVGRKSTRKMKEIFNNLKGSRRSNEK